MKNRKSNGWLSNKDYHFVYRRAIRCCIDLAVISENKLLLVMRDIPPYKNRWSLPGGMQRRRETTEQAIVRIARGELGIELTRTPNLIGYIDVLRDGPFLHSKSNVFLLRITPEEAKEITLDKQARRFKFWDHLPSRAHEGQRKFMEEHLFSTLTFS